MEVSPVCIINENFDGASFCSFENISPTSIEEYSSFTVYTNKVLQHKKGNNHLYRYCVDFGYYCSNNMHSYVCEYFVKEYICTVSLL